MMTQATRTFRVFVSSTFSDLKAERDALQESRKVGGLRNKGPNKNDANSTDFDFLNRATQR